MTGKTVNDESLQKCLSTFLTNRYVAAAHLDSIFEEFGCPDWLCLSTELQADLGLDDLDILELAIELADLLEAPEQAFEIELADKDRVTVGAVLAFLKKMVPDEKLLKEALQ